MHETALRTHTHNLARVAFKWSQMQNAFNKKQRVVHTTHYYTTWHTTNKHESLVAKNKKINKLCFSMYLKKKKKKTYCHLLFCIVAWFEQLICSLPLQFPSALPTNVTLVNLHSFIGWRRFLWEILISQKWSTSYNCNHRNETFFSLILSITRLVLLSPNCFP